MKPDAAAAVVAAAAEKDSAVSDPAATAAAAEAPAEKIAETAVPAGAPADGAGDPAPAGASAAAAIGAAAAAAAATVVETVADGIRASTAAAEVPAEEKETVTTASDEGKEKPNAAAANGQDAAGVPEKKPGPAAVENGSKPDKEVGGATAVVESGDAGSAEMEMEQAAEKEDEEEEAEKEKDDGDGESVACNEGDEGEEEGDDGDAEEKQVAANKKEKTRAKKAKAPAMETKTPEMKAKEEAKAAEGAAIGGGRRRKSVERLGDDFVAEKKTTEIAKGKGTAFKDIPNVAEKLGNLSRNSPLVGLLHNLVFGGKVKKTEVKAQLLQFSGIPDDDTLDKVTARLDNNKKWPVTVVKEAMDLLEVPRGSASFEEGRAPDRGMLTGRLLEWLQNPVASDKESRGSIKKAKKAATPAKKKSKASSPKPKSAAKKAPAEKTPAKNAPAKKTPAKKTSPLVTKKSPAAKPKAAKKKPALFSASAGMLSKRKASGGGAASPSAKRAKLPPTKAPQKRKAHEVEEEQEEKEDEAEEAEEEEEESAGPSSGDLRAKVKELIDASEDVASLTFKMMKSQLEEHFGVALGDRKTELIEYLSEAM